MPQEPERPQTAGSHLSDWTESSYVEPDATPLPEAGFTPGTMLAGRYRVVALLGRGGMGEVYRADDVKLGQPVALKFVRGALSAETRERLYAEVRVGRQLAHPGICRLYDVVEVDGQTFLAMEYVDGEDLASLLARIGRLPADKAIDITRDLCAGLAAMHDKGILHRDLKPGNVMIDGRDRARLTDFGLAVGLAGPTKPEFAGTPAYMPPEQLAGGPLTERTDLYAFALIAYEIITGRRFYDAKTMSDLLAQHRETKTSQLASVARMVDPRVERLIAQCLDENPAARPASARAVLALLPGHDPLEAAVAAGETPSPEAVAAAARVGDLTPGVAWACLAAVLAGLVAVAWLSQGSELYRDTLLPKPAPVLAQRARDVQDALGQTASADEAFSFEWDRAHFAYVMRHDSSVDRWARLGRATSLVPLSFFHRRSPRKLVASHRDGMVRRDDPPLDVPGMSEVVLDSRGRLLSFVAVPPPMEAASAWPEPDWAPLFREAGLDAASFRPVAPEWTAPVDSDRKAAWEGPYPGEPAVSVRIEAASHHGRPVWFAVLPPWASEARSRVPAVAPTPVGQVGVLVLALALPVGGALLARRNLRLGRGDRKGAFRVALFVFAAYAVAGLLRADHVTDLGQELWILIKVFAYPCFWAALVWLLYIALEPYARRRWPLMLVSWKRLLAGSLRDPLVGRDVLLGVGSGVALMLLFLASVILPTFLGRAPMSPGAFLDGSVLTSFHQAVFRVFVNVFSAVLYGMVFLFLLTLLRMLLRRPWLAAAVWCVFLSAPLPGEDPVLGWIGGLVRATVFLAVLVRGGLLALVTALYVMFAMTEVPATLHLSAWYTFQSLPVVAAVLMLAVYGFVTSLGGKPILGGGLLDD
ncbi:MAG TPA: serine/threonine-protein kinase [Vicinamibacteria bacterium]|nr:serine/threonine-protein kinase [Vicinamibacteria bacterium]